MCAAAPRESRIKYNHLEMGLIWDLLKNFGNPRCLERPCLLLCPLVSQCECWPSVPTVYKAVNSVSQLGLLKRRRQAHPYWVKRGDAAGGRPAASLTLLTATG